MNISLRPAADWHERQPQLTYVFTLALYGLAAMAGTASSVLFIGAGMWTTLLLGFYRVKPIASRGARVLALVFAFYYLSGALNAVLHWGDRESLALLITRLPFLAFFPAISHQSLSGSRRLLGAVENGALIGVGLAVPVVVYQLARSMPRPEAFSGNPAMFALAATLLFVICCVAARRRGGRAELLFMSGAVVAGFLILASGTRSFWPLILAGPLVAWVVVREPETPRVLNRTVAVALMAILAVAAAAAGERISQRVDALTHELSAGDAESYQLGSLQTRLAIWRCGAGVLEKHALTGAGVAGAREAMQECAREEGYRWVALSHYHNFALDGLAKGGVIELAARLVLLAAPLLVITAMYRRSAGPAALRAPVLALTGLVTATFLASGLFGIFVGHDIADALYLYTMMSLCCIALNDTGAQDRT